MPKERPSAPPLSEMSPMLLSESKAIPKGNDWTFEIKWDGYRIVASTGPNARLRTKGGADATAWFPEVVASLAQLPSGSIVDGEVCVLDEIGRSDFVRVHARARRRRWYEGADVVTYLVFDQLVGGNRDIRSEPLEKRRRALAKLMAGRPNGLLLVSAVDDGGWLFANALALDLEGIVAKRRGSTYQSGVRSTDWIKVKRPGAVPAQRFKR